MPSSHLIIVYNDRVVINASLTQSAKYREILSGYLMLYDKGPSFRVSAGWCFSRTSLSAQLSEFSARSFLSRPHTSRVWQEAYYISWNVNTTALPMITKQRNRKKWTILILSNSVLFSLNLTKSEFGENNFSLLVFNSNLGKGLSIQIWKKFSAYNNNNSLWYTPLQRGTCCLGSGVASQRKKYVQ